MNDMTRWFHVKPCIGLVSAACSSSGLHSESASLVRRNASSCASAMAAKFLGEALGGRCFKGVSFIEPILCKGQCTFHRELVLKKVHGSRTFCLQCS